MTTSVSQQQKKKKVDKVVSAFIILLPSSSAGMATRGMMSKLWVLFITSGLVLRSDCEELDDARGRRLRKIKVKCRSNKNADFS